jgi:hypothetical protein
MAARKMEEGTDAIRRPDVLEDRKKHSDVDVRTSVRANVDIASPSLTYPLFCHLIISFISTSVIAQPTSSLKIA